jgi:cobalt-zinc-cadmium efflux system membrane fusion protein
MKYSLQLLKQKSASTAKLAAVCLAANLLLAACGEHNDASRATYVAPASGGAPSEPTVTLTSNQLGAIKIANSTVSVFHNVREAVGVVNFAQDPNIVQGGATLLTAAASYAVAERELKRAKDLLATKGVSEREVEQATSDDQTAKAALDAARSALLLLGKSDAEIDHIIATGKIGSSGGMRRGTKWVLANAPEADAASFHVGQPLHVVVEATSSHEFSGMVAEVYAAVDPNLHRVTLRGVVDDPNDELRPGMLVGVRIEVAKPTTSVAIAANGVVREGDGTMTAWITSDRQHFVQKRVEIGMLEDGKVQILTGLQPGQLVVTDGAVLLDNVLLAPSGD